MAVSSAACFRATPHLRAMGISRRRRQNRLEVVRRGVANSDGLVQPYGRRRKWRYGPRKCVTGHALLTEISALCGASLSGQCRSWRHEGAGVAADQPFLHERCFAFPGFEAQEHKPVRFRPRDARFKKRAKHGYPALVGNQQEGGIAFALFNTEIAVRNRGRLIQTNAVFAQWLDID